MTVDFAALAPGAEVGPFTASVSPEANRRYWQAAGVDHPALRAGALYPPIAANLTILALQQRCAVALLQTGQRVRSHRRAEAGTALRAQGEVTQRYEKRGRPYVEVEVVVSPAADPDVPVWTSVATFTPTVPSTSTSTSTSASASASRSPSTSPSPSSPSASPSEIVTPNVAPRRIPSRFPREDVQREEDAGGVRGGVHRRTLELTPEAIRAYSRRGNFHSEPDEARRLGLPGLVAQGVQVAGPAYGLLLDAWGEGFLARGEVTWKFVGMVVDGQAVEATVDLGGGDDDATATLEVVNTTTGATAVVGTAHRLAP